uniref:Uncharacterized protein n=1 Tax=Ulva partita TaxID=1605170 RepID=A0A1C9ZWG6_9CHLO|nr:hypothetical protein [Ulva partita]
MLTKFNRCTTCGWTLDDKGQHAKGHSCDPSMYNKRTTGVRKDLEENKNPNRKVNFPVNAK